MLVEHDIFIRFRMTITSLLPDDTKIPPTNALNIA